MNETINNNAAEPVTCKEGIIGVQGQQGCNGHYYWSTGCSGISHTIDTKNTTNIYNYMACTGCTGCTGCAASILSKSTVDDVVEAPTETYLSACFDHNRVAYGITVTPDGYTLPFASNMMNQLVPIINTSGSHALFQIRSRGVYEINYHIYLKESATIGARLRKNTEFIDSSIIQADSVVSHLSSTSLVHCWENDLISVELFSNSDTQIELKGLIGASITMKRLTNG